VIFSHANPRAVQADRRNITDEQIDACVATGGIVCVNGVGRFLTDPKGGTPAILDCIDHLADRIGPERIGLGIDYCYPANGLDEHPPGLDRGYWWPAAHGYGSGITGIKIAARSSFPRSRRASPPAATASPRSAACSAATCWSWRGRSGSHGAPDAQSCQVNVAGSQR
jgi:hypothetical protein